MRIHRISILIDKLTIHDLVLHTRTRCHILEFPYSVEMSNCNTSGNLFQAQCSHGCRPSM